MKINSRFNRGTETGPMTLEPEDIIDTMKRLFSFATAKARLTILTTWAIVASAVSVN